MRSLGWKLVVFFAVICLLTACTFPDCTDRGRPCDFLASIGIPI